MGALSGQGGAHTELLERLLDDASSFEDRFQPDYGTIEKIVGEIRERGLRVVLTSGSFDILHEGHSMYLEAARAYGDFLIVGVDSDEFERKRPSGAMSYARLFRFRSGISNRGLGEPNCNAPPPSCTETPTTD